MLLNNLLGRDTIGQLSYRLLDVQNNMITLLVKDVDLEKLNKILSSIGFIKKKHPMGVEKGYKFLYQMAPFQLYQKDEINIEIFCQLPCASLTPKTWIPLDRLIQKRLWENPPSHR